MRRARATAWAIALTSALATACILPNPDYDGTEFTCAEPPQSCPGGYVCRLGVCEREANAPDGGLPGDASPPTAPDAGVPQNDQPDAGPPPVTMTLTFGERPGDDVRGVTTDTFLRNDKPNQRFGDHGDVSVNADPAKHGLLRFELSALPAGATIDSAVLEVNVSDPVESGELLLYRLVEDWEELEATWNERRNGQRWTAPGAAPPMSALPIAQASLAARDTGLFTVTLPATLVQSWVDQPSSNFGVVWISTSPDGYGGVFDSRDSNHTELRPQLSVTFH